MTSKSGNKESKRWLSTRDVLWILVFFGTGYNYMIRLNINIAIVSMVKEYNTDNILNKEEQSSECFNAQAFTNLNNTIFQPTEVTNKENRFDWNEYEQGVILGAFYWLYWAGQIPGGVLSQRYGTKAVFGFSNLGLCLCGFLIPFAANFNYHLLIALRMLQGIIGGLAWPSLHTLVGLWIPPNERSQFITSYMGSSIGAALIYPVCGLLIDWYDWPLVFYFTSALGVIWFISWWFLAYDSPEDHPTISEDERLFIQKSLGQTVTKTKAPTPWKKILLSRPMWVINISQWGNLWGLFTLITQAPTFFKFIHGWDIRMTGMLSGIPHIARLILAYLTSAGCDYLLKHNKMSRTNVRKLAMSITCLVQGFLIFCLGFTGCNFIAAIILLTIATAASGAEAAGALGNMVDLSPNYASVMCGISQTVAVIPGILSPIVVSFFTYENQTVGQWQKVFLVSTAVLIIPGLINLCFTSSELQKWNTPNIKGHELKQLHSKTSEEDEKSESKNRSIA